MHEIRHALDFFDHPELAYFATRSRTPGAGIAHFVFEARGYFESHGLRGALNPRAVLRSVEAYTINNVPQFRHHLFYRDLAMGVSVLGLGSGLYLGGAYDESTYSPLFEE